MAGNQENILEQAQKSLIRMQQFDTSCLPRKADLGTALCFDDAVEPANSLIGLYKKLTVTALDDFPDERLRKIKDNADSDFALFEKVLKFDPANQNKPEHDNIVNQIWQRYDQAFEVLHPLISYSMHKATDFENLDARARAKFQEIEDRSSKTQNELLDIKQEAELTLEKVQGLAAELGVTQQAVYFKDEAKKHDTESDKWLKYTKNSAIAVGSYALILLIMSAFGWPNITDKYQVIQFTTSKLLVFFTLSFALYFTARNYFSHKHNSIVNKHRQNALVTYRAIVEAAASTANTDIILNQASTCIFLPQETGFSGGKASGAFSANSPFNFLLKTTTEKGD